MIIGFDTETTGLPQPSIIPLSGQPEIVEYAGIKYDDDLNEIGRLEFLCKPRIPITPQLTKIHGITNEAVQNEKPFAAHYKELCEFHLGVNRLIGQNLKFDITMLDLELRRLDLNRKFPWSPMHTCTMDLSSSTGRFEKKSLGFVYEQLFGEPIPGAHRAMNDVKAMMRIYKELSQ